MTLRDLERPDVDDAISWRRPGEPVLIRFIKGGEQRPHFVVPMRVVRDDAELTMLYGAAGSSIRKRVYADGSFIPRDLPYREWARLDLPLGEGTWAPYHTLSIVPAGAAYDIRYVWHQDDWSFAGWYVNLQAPLQRVPTGYDGNDWDLDIVVDPDGRWEWKDQDELDDAVTVGEITPELAARIRAIGESIIPMIESRAWPFDGTLVDWRPDSEWTTPAIPDSWNEVFS